MSTIIETLLDRKAEKTQVFHLKDVGCFIRGLTYSSDDVTEDRSKTMVYRANNLKYGSGINCDDIVYVTKTPQSQQLIRKGDVVVCMANGSSVLVGKNSYAPFDNPHATIGAFCGIYRSKYPIIRWLFQAKTYKRKVYQSLQGGNGAIANLNGEDILNMSFGVIPTSEMSSICNILTTIDNHIDVNMQLHNLYTQQKSCLLNQMFI